MRLLLDTHLVLWAAYSPARLSRRARALIKDSENALVFSALSIWEIAVKAGLGRPSFDIAPAVLRRALIEAGYLELDITIAHAVAVGQLPPIHHDPFDRVLVAQSSRVEGFTLLTADKRVAEYGAPVLLV
ncbi:type II toxin-antitoxin system VapC family toxin [Rathayibacter soli]|uniref:type II toxin-antitoxin system VapC family toxin n=1 Tax=Rathayibacter soli TaxID=3144168 RepID=UPI0027E4F034|nr:type II toxin-antitoxin system VapC family toxin [Glaciibacter superstes]